MGCAVIHVFLLETTYGSAFDMASYDQQAYAATHGLNVYEYTARYPYPPVWICLRPSHDWRAAPRLFGRRWKAALCSVRTSHWSAQAHQPL